MELRPPLHLRVVAIEKGAFESPLTKVANFTFLFYSWLVGLLVLWHINLCRLFNAKSIFMQIIRSIENSSV